MAYRVHVYTHACLFVNHDLEQTELDCEKTAKLESIVWGCGESSPAMLNSSGDEGDADDAGGDIAISGNFR